MTLNYLLAGVEPNGALVEKRQLDGTQTLERSYIHLPRML